MRIWRWIVLVPLVVCAGCEARYDAHEDGRSLTASQRAVVEKGVRGFVQNVARAVAQEGPGAWRKEFADSPSFFMASEGRLVFANGDAAAQGIQDLTHMIKHIELRWGDDLRVDALTPRLAVVGTSWQEVREDTQGHQVTESGYFTGLVEKREGQWQFRNAHWSVAAPAGKVP